MIDAEKNVLITGIPRSGTTLVTALFDSLANSACLSEPSWQAQWVASARDAADLARRICADIPEIRYRILSGDAVEDRLAVDGKTVTNYFERTNSGSVNNAYEITHRRRIVKNEDFLLGIKHNALYTATLDNLVNMDGFKILCIVRHPVPTILSWQSLKVPVSYGRMPHGERFWPELRRIIATEPDILVRQIRILDLFCDRYLMLSASHSSRVALVRYEDFVRDPGILENMTGSTYERQIPISNQNRSNHYRASHVDKVIALVEKHATSALRLYSAKDY